MDATNTLEKDAIQEDFLPLNGTDHIEFYVGNAKQSAYFYECAFGYKLVARFSRMSARGPPRASLSHNVPQDFRQME